MVLFHAFSTLELTAPSGCQLNRHCTLPSVPGGLHIAPGGLCSLGIYGPRSLQVKELGAIVYNCSHLAQDLEKTFQTYWVLGSPQAVLPKTWPRNFSTHINRFHPLRGFFDGVPTTAYFSVRWLTHKSSGLHQEAGSTLEQDAGPAPAVRERYWKVADLRSRLLGGLGPRGSGWAQGRVGRPRAPVILYSEGR